MLRKNLLVFLLLFSFNAFAQVDSSHVRISLLTCGSGSEPWETFGHTAIRVTDSLAGTDNVYNYGTFNGYDDGFLLKFARGKLLYYLSYYPYPNFVEEYAQSNRSVREQLLNVGGPDKLEIYNFLINNARDENKYYKYDFFYDNCATRIRDAFPSALGSQFHYANTLPSQKISFRNIINQYFYRVHWQRFGVNLLLGSRIDKIMTNKDVMFLPDFLESGIAGATLNGQKITSPSKVIVDGSPHLPAGVNGPLLVTSLIALLTILGLFVPTFKKLKSIMVFFVLFLTGFLGCFMLVMWIATDHQGCSNNFNLLWALPTNLLVAITPRMNRSRHALISIGLIFISLLLHLLKVQELPLVELSPLLLALLLVQSTVFRKASSVTR